MTWFRVDDKLHDHRKARLARKGGDKPRDAAPIGLWVLAGSWCMANLTDGFVPEDELQRWDSEAERLAEQLVRADLWERAERDGEAGYLFHEWDEWQHTAAYIQKRRDEAANRMRRRRANTAVTSDNSNSAERSHELSSDVRKPPTQPNQKNTRAPARETDEAFDRFWSAYPKRVGKKAAHKAFTKAARDTDAETIIAGARAAAAGWKACATEPRFIPHPSTWLNRGSWEDEQQLPASSTPTPLPVDPSDPEPDPVTQPDDHLAWRQRRAAARTAAH